MTASFVQAPGETVDVGGTPFAYRELGPAGGVPLVLLNHITAVLDDWDPAVVDGFATERRVIVVDLRGVGGSGGTTPDSIEAMAADTVAFLEALGLDVADLLGFSLGGMVAQAVVQQRPDLVRRIDVLVPTISSFNLARLLPNATLSIYPGRGPRRDLPVPRPVRSAGPGVPPRLTGRHGAAAIGTVALIYLDHDGRRWFTIDQPGIAR
ncbi:alpha/beta fold hydrolase [Kribbella sp. NPDC051718]|uniref:alpha/beta fold hydrolase n=1 Tax=Kribbella sp. NPDC051718 TaxID=3155168 RepID=UPI0034468293